MLAELQFPNLDPTIVNIWGPLALRWYGLMYVLAFVFGFYALKWMQKVGYLRVKPEDIQNIIVVGVLGTFLGGRLGYLLFYQFDELILNIHNIPFSDRLGKMLKVWEGGMSFHGGVIGVIVAVFIYCRVAKKPFWNIGDASVHIVPLGVALVRIGNFINGELYGRTINDAQGKPITDSAQLPWYAMKFPTELSSHTPEAARALREAIRDDYLATHPEVAKWAASPDPILQDKADAALRGLSTLPVKPEVWESVQHLFPGRIPSQLIQFFFEGFLLWLAIWIGRRWCKRPGILGGFMLIGYAIFRIPAEMVRQPDAQIDPGKAAQLADTAKFLSNIGMTMGQFLSVLLVIGGAAVIALASGPKNPLTGDPYPPEARRWPFFKSSGKPESKPAPSGEQAAEKVEKEA